MADTHEVERLITDKVELFEEDKSDLGRNGRNKLLNADKNDSERLKVIMIEDYNNKASASQSQSYNSAIKVVLSIEHAS